MNSDYIEKSGSGYEVKSESGKNLGHEPSKAAAEKRLAQVEYFKHKGGDDATESDDDMNNVNKPMTMSKSEENVQSGGNPDTSVPPMFEANMDMAIYEKDGWENSHMQRKDALESSETAGGAVGKDPEAKHDADGSTAGGAVGKDPEAKHDSDGSGYEVANGFKPGWGGDM
jgi:hypothetical protein